MIEHALPFDEAGSEIGIWIEQNVRMVERGDQLDVRRKQHGVAEHVAGHVADADDRKVFALGVDTQLAEVALHRLPSAPRRDAHRFVVVAGAPT